MPEPQTSKELTEFIKLIIVLLVTIAAVVFGLQTTSVKSAFDTAEHDRANYAAQLTLLDQCMRNYGLGSEFIRRHLQSFTAAAIASNWRSEAAPLGVSCQSALNFGSDAISMMFRHAYDAPISLAWRRSIFARPYIWRFTSLSLFI